MSEYNALLGYYQKRAEAFQKELFVLKEDLRDYEAHMESLRQQGKRVDLYREGRKRRYLMAKIEATQYFAEAEKLLVESIEGMKQDA